MLSLPETKIASAATWLSSLQAAELAKDFTSKLITSSAAEARSSMMKLAGDVSSWWAALDPGLAKPQETSQNTERNIQARPGFCCVGTITACRNLFYIDFARDCRRRHPNSKFLRGNFSLHIPNDEAEISWWESSLSFAL